MALTRPTLSEILARVRSDLKSGLGLTTILRRSFEEVWAKVVAGVSHTLHGHISYAILNKFFPDEGDEATVVRWGALYNLPRNEATFARVIVEMTGTTGGTVADGTLFTRSDGFEYEVDGAVAVPAAGTAEVIAQCLTEGAEGNMEVDDELPLQSPIAGVESTGVITGTDQEGEDQEDLEDYRERVLERMQDPPAGGKASDYIAFAKAVTGVTRAWALPNHIGQGTVGLTFVEDGEDPIIPDSAKVDEVQEYVLTQQPINADLYTFAPTELEMNPSIALKPNTAEVQAAVIAELEEMLEREGQVRDAVDPDQVGLGVQFTGIIPLSLIDEAISIAAGEQDHTVISPVANIQPPSGGLVTLGTPVFSTLP